LFSLFVLVKSMAEEYNPTINFGVIPVCADSNFSQHLLTTDRLSTQQLDGYTSEHIL
jgi:hypothetical protein